ncbi:MAG TPA: hypothetical protein PK431_17540 [Chitinophagales bacterium]|nr:hypothetical protein [Chitinophagales bacterium]
MKTIKSIAICVFIICAFACKKETTETNDPKIDDRIVNISLDSNSSVANKTIDIDDDGTNDFMIFISHPGAVLSNSQVGINGMGNTEFVTSLVGSAGDVITTLNSGAIINSTTGTWKSLATFFFFDAAVSSTKFGFTDVGDKLVAFRLVDGANYYYGWMKVNIVNGQEITIKEFGLQTAVNTAIAAGSK